MGDFDKFVTLIPSHLKILLIIVFLIKIQVYNKNNILIQKKSEKGDCEKKIRKKRFSIRMHCYVVFDSY